jgi:hypothetical protein
VHTKINNCIEVLAGGGLPEFTGEMKAKIQSLKVEETNLKKNLEDLAWTSSAHGAVGIDAKYAINALRNFHGLPMSFCAPCAGRSNGNCIKIGRTLNSPSTARSRLIPFIFISKFLSFHRPR